MRKKRILLAIGAAAFALTAGGAVAYAASPSEEPAPRLEVESVEDLTADQKEIVRLIENDLPISVLNAEGKPAGFVRDSELVARDDRIIPKVIEGYGEPEPDDTEYDRLFEALRILDPVPVVDDNGKVVGYFAGSFMSIEDRERSVAGAQELADELLQ